ncbi:hypothetical protein B0H11DRAFT_2225591 [Mycena galericulata]|nr:hypothetical protein B0H11DRAFT_2225591 [Mycena galericulata]
MAHMTATAEALIEIIPLIHPFTRPQTTKLEEDLVMRTGDRTHPEITRTLLAFITSLRLSLDPVHLLIMHHTVQRLSDPQLRSPFHPPSRYLTVEVHKSLGLFSIPSHGTRPHTAILTTGELAAHHELPRDPPAVIIIDARIQAALDDHIRAKLKVTFLRKTLLTGQMHTLPRRIHTRWSRECLVNLPPRHESPTTSYTPSSSASAHPPAPPSNGGSSPSSRAHSLPLPVVSLRRHHLPWWHYHLKTFLFSVLVLVFVKLPRQIYLHFLLRLPLLYFSRVSRLFEDANLSLPDIRRMAVANADQWKDGTPGALPTAWIPSEAAISPNLLNLRHSWEAFIDSLLREWKTQNVVAILTMLQIDAAATDPIARTTALLSLISALMSLLFGSMYIVRFGTMRKMYKAASWADEAQKGHTSILWNVWVMLAIPAVWLAWSIILFVTCIMAFAWRTGAAGDSNASVLSNNAARGLRIGVSAVLGVALVYLFLIVRTFRKYGDVMDQEWNEKVFNWAREGRKSQSQSFAAALRIPIPAGAPILALWRAHAQVAFDICTSAAAFGRPFTPKPELSSFYAIKVRDFRYGSECPPPSLVERDILPAEWLRFSWDVEQAWNGLEVLTEAPPFNIEPNGVVGARDRAAGMIHVWNHKFFLARSTEAVLCLERPTLGPPSYAVYLKHRSTDTPFGPLAHGLHSLTVIHLVEDANHGQSTIQYEIGPVQQGGERARGDSLSARGSPPVVHADQPPASGSLPLPPSPSGVVIKSPVPVRPVRPIVLESTQSKSET